MLGAFFMPQMLKFDFFLKKDCWNVLWYQISVYICTSFKTKQDDNAKNDCRI